METQCASALCTVTCVPCLLLLFLFPTFQTAGAKQREKSLQGAVLFLNATLIYVDAFR